MMPLAPRPLAAALLLALAACAPRGALTIDPTAAEGSAAVQTILVASARDRDGGPTAFAAARSPEVNFARFEVAVPPQRSPGTVTFPQTQPPNPQTDFVTVSARAIRDRSGFIASVNRQLAQLPPESREIFLFTHGFNTNFAEGLYRQAQMRHDFAASGVAVHFSWPSAGDVRAYAYDRESAIFARDALAAALEALAASDARAIVVGAHSMGAMLMMEALRSLAVAGSPAFFDKLQAVVLMAPDLDVDVFRGQASALPPGTPVYVFFSSRDRALRASSWLRGGSDRLGAIRDPALLQDLDVTLIDTSSVDDGEDALGHFAVATSPAMISVIRGLSQYGTEIFVDAENSPSPVQAAFNVVQGVGEAVLSPLAE
jgi:esterase/lipase superfamily enzyme